MQVNHIPLSLYAGGVCFVSECAGFPRIGVIFSRCFVFPRSSCLTPRILTLYGIIAVVMDAFRMGTRAPRASSHLSVRLTAGSP